MASKCCALGFDAMVTLSVKCMQAHNVTGGAGGTKQACSLLQLLQAIIGSQPLKQYGHSSEDLHSQTFHFRFITYKTLVITV